MLWKIQEVTKASTKNHQPGKSIKTSILEIYFSLELINGNAYIGIRAYVFLLTYDCDHFGL